MKCEVCGGLGLVHGLTGIIGRCYCIYGANYPGHKSADTYKDVMAFSVKHEISYNDAIIVLTSKPAHRKLSAIEWDESDWTLAQKYRKLKNEMIKRILDHNT